MGTCCWAGGFAVRLIDRQRVGLGGMAKQLFKLNVVHGA
jgi:hypothetical protein